MQNGASELTKRFVIPNELGLHARAATKLTQVASGFTSSVHVELIGDDGPRVNGKSVLDLLTLGAEQGSQLEVIVSGPDAQEALDAIDSLFADNLGD